MTMPPPAVVVSTSKQVFLLVINILLLVILLQAALPLSKQQQQPRDENVYHVHIAKRFPHAYHEVVKRSMAQNAENDVKLLAKYGIMNMHDFLAAKVTKERALASTTAEPPTGPINCTRLAKRHPVELTKAEIALKKGRKRIKPTDLINMTADCDWFLKSRGYPDKPLSKEEAEFPVAFSIRLHRSPEQAERLLRAIYMPQNIYCIYVDKKSHDVIHNAMKGIAKCLPNVFIASNLSVFTYASFSPVEADLQCAKELLAKPVRWRYYMNLAGQEFPLKTNLEVVRILKFLNGTNDIETYPFPALYNWRIDKVYKIENGEPRPTNQKKEKFQKGNVTLHKGGAYNTFSREFMEWVLSNKLAQDFIDWAKDTFSPDEFIWASLVQLPDAPGGYPVMVTQISKTHISREVIWSWNAAYCYGKYIREICIFSAGDLAWLDIRWELVANKFDLDYDHVVVECLEEMLHQRRLEANPDKYLNWATYRNLPHVSYRRNHPPGR